MISDDEQQGVDLKVAPEGRDTVRASEKKHFDDNDGKQESPTSLMAPGQMPRLGVCGAGQVHSPVGEPKDASTAVIRPRGHETDTVFDIAE